MTRTPDNMLGDADDALTVEEVLSRREEFIGERFVIAAKVLFTFTCPPPEQFPTGDCIATPYLVTDETLDLQPNGTSNAILLSEEGSPVTCTAQTLAGLDCKGWMHDRRYIVSGELNRLILGGRPSDRLVLEVTDKEIL